MRASLYADVATTAPRVRFACLAVVACLWACALPGAGRAGIIYTLTEVGPDVVGSGSGTLDITDLSQRFNISGSSAFLEATFGTIITGTSGEGFPHISGPLSFGSGVGELATSQSGDYFGIERDKTEPNLLVPTGYVSGTALSATDTWSGQNFASLGLIPGTYTWTWGSGTDADFFTLQVGPTAAPEPASLTLLGLGVAGIAGYAWRRRR
jgi:hypothetical protein